ncbi:hypothetical protein [Paenibacillus pinihumi]|uniref:hypothetical protein n=1 Tax=Paenibacillus pinihumi TaxID=669462 RepID=UPI000413E6F6|nr:hypothetical protein [Paenibacillus pinihumi]
MWYAQLLSTNLYGFRHESGTDDWAATTAVLHEGDSRVTLQASICLTYLSGRDEYERLLEAIRSLADDQARQAGRDGCRIDYHCTGLLDGISLEATGTIGSRQFADLAFSEERW